MAQHLGLDECLACSNSSGMCASCRTRLVMVTSGLAASHLHQYTGYNTVIWNQAYTNIRKNPLLECIHNIMHCYCSTLHLNESMLLKILSVCNEPPPPPHPPNPPSCYPTPVHNQTDPSPTPPCGQSRMMQACGCRGPAGSWNIWPAGRPGRAWGGLRRPRRCAAQYPPRSRPEGGCCCCHHQGCRVERSWPGTAATRSQLWAHRSSSTGPEGRAYTLTGWLACWEEVRRRKGRCSWGVAQRRRPNWRFGVWLQSLRRRWL